MNAATNRLARRTFPPRFSLERTKQKRLLSYKTHRRRENRGLNSSEQPRDWRSGGGGLPSKPPLKWLCQWRLSDVCAPRGRGSSGPHQGDSRPSRPALTTTPRVVTPVAERRTTGKSPAAQKGTEQRWSGPRARPALLPGQGSARQAAPRLRSPPRPGPSPRGHGLSPPSLQAVLGAQGADAASSPGRAKLGADGCS